MIIRCVLLLAVLLAPLSYGDDDQIVIIANSFNPITALDEREAKKLFLGKEKRFSNGVRARLIDQPDNNPIKKTFYLAVTGKSLVQITGRWASLVFSGDTIPPEVGKDDEAIKDWIAENVSGIGYIYRKNIDDRVKILYRVPNP